MNRIACVVLVFAGAMVSFGVSADRPNVLLLMADDLGYSDLGCFGGEIQTPRIDRLAAEGLRFSHFRATPMCVTSRIALMSGMPMHRAGQHSYRHSIPLPRLLKAAGYRTMMTGKWHGGSPDPRSPDLFDRSFGFLGGATDSFVGGKDWFFDDKPYDHFSEDFYSTRVFADRSIEFMQEAVAVEKPFFMYVAFNAPHHPCQAPKPTVEKYSQTYLRGYERLRKTRRDRQITLGLVDPDWPVAPVGNEVRRWDELTDHRKTVEAGRMAAYAAAVDEVDQAVGRMLDYLHDAGLAQNTIVIFLSDNGGDYSNGAIATDEQQVAWLPHTNPSSSNGWASVKCTPFRFYKHSCHEGGVATPMVIRWPKGVTHDAGKLIDAPTSITDIYPTLMDLAGARYPPRFEGRETRLPTGASLLPLFRNDRRETPAVFQWYAFSRAWIEDEWKAVSLYNGPWQLFNLRHDRCESTDVSNQHSERLANMIERWQAFAVQSGVPVESSESVTQHQWGWHRLNMAFPELASLTPANGSVADPDGLELVLSFNEPISFAGTEGRKIALYDISNESEPVWQADPDSASGAQGEMTVRFQNIPRLLPNRHYAVRSDAGWIKVGGRPAGALNDGAFWWRFRTQDDSPKP
jgi:arylsulfatase